MKQINSLFLWDSQVILLHEKYCFAELKLCNKLSGLFEFQIDFFFYNVLSLSWSEIFNFQGKSENLPFPYAPSYSSFKIKYVLQSPGFSFPQIRHKVSNFVFYAAEREKSLLEQKYIKVNCIEIFILSQQYFADLFVIENVHLLSNFQFLMN